MRDPDRIDPFLKDLRKIWLKFPDLRFGQLIENLDLKTFMYYIEDNDLLENLKTLYGTPVKNVIIIGAAGRDFHNFNIYFKDNPEYNVVAFTATQIPGIDDKVYPAELAGDMYPAGIPIYHEDMLDDLIVDHKIDLCVFAYSDVTYDHIANIGNMVELYGAKLITLTPEQTQIKSTLPVISVTATRTGCGKSSVSLKIAKLLTDKGFKVGVIRHPMPYADDLKTQEAQKFSKVEDLEFSTIEEREEYEPYIEAGLTIWAGIDYEMILKDVEEESDIILWDGGNNDFSFIKPDLSIVVADLLRVGDELKYYPSDINVKNADVVICNKYNSATDEDVVKLYENIRSMNLKCKVIYTSSIITIDDPELIKNKNVVVIEDGPTLTHGGMRVGAGVLSFSDTTTNLVDAKPYAVGSLIDIYKKYDHIFNVIPAVGYSDQQLADLEYTINAVPCDVVIIATPVDLPKLISINKPYTRVRYNIEDNGKIEYIINKFTTMDLGRIINYEN